MSISSASCTGSDQRRNFSKAVLKPGTARQARDIVTQAVRESSLCPQCPRSVQPLDFESFQAKNRTVLDHDAHRDLVLFPRDDISHSVKQRDLRTVSNSVSASTLDQAKALFTQECLKSYVNDWQLISFNYSSQYGADFARLLQNFNREPFPELTYECDLETNEDGVLAGGSSSNVCGRANLLSPKRCKTVLKEGFVLGPQTSSSETFMGGFKSQKKRFCVLTQEVDGSYHLDFYKDKTSKGASKMPIIYLEASHELVLNLAKRGKSTLELKTIGATACSDVTSFSSKASSAGADTMNGSQQPTSYLFSFDSDVDCQAWNSAIGGCIEKMQAAAKKAKLEESVSTGSGHASECGSNKEDSLERIKYADIVKYSNETDQTVAFARQHNRRNLFGLYPDIVLSTSSDPHSSSSHDSEKSTIPRSPAALTDENLKPFDEPPCTRFLVECKCINLKLPVQTENGESILQVEPFFVTLSLFDLSSGKKLSEDFTCDVNPADLKSHWFAGSSSLKRSHGSDLPSAVVTNGSLSNGHATPINGTPRQNSTASSNQAAPAGPELRGVDRSWLLMPSRKAIFSVNVSQPSRSEIYLVARVDKVLQGNIASGQEPYVKPDVKSSAKVVKNLKQYCAKLGSYRMPFAWAARPLLRKLVTGSGGAGDNMPLYKQEQQKLSDDELLRLIADLRRPEKAAKMCALSGTISIAVDVAADAEKLKCCVTPSYLPLTPFQSPPTSSPILQLQSFGAQKVEDAVPHTSFVNHLYVYPLSLKFDNQKTFGKARNILCMVQFMDTDKPGTPAIPCIYAKRDGMEVDVFTDRSYCAVTHHETNPEFYNEIKIALPVDIHEKHHVLFTFYHVSVDSVLAAKKRDATETIVGYAWAALVKDQKAVIPEDLNLRVSASLPEGYLGCRTATDKGGGTADGYCADVRWLDGGKPLLHATLRLCSTVFTRDAHLQNFFAYCQRMSQTKTMGDCVTPERVKKDSIASNGSRASITATNNANGSVGAKPSDDELTRLIKTLHAVDSVTLINFLPVILNQLLNILPAVENENAALNIIRTLVHMLHEVDANGKGDLLRAYVKFVFIPCPDVGARNFHEELLKALTAFLRPGKVDGSIVAKFLRQSWFFVDLLAKSMAYKLIISGRFKMSRTERFSADCQFRVETFMQTAIAYIKMKYHEIPEETRAANESLASLVKKCFSLMNRGFVFQLIHSYLKEIDLATSKTLVQFKLDFLESICCHEHFVPLAIPILCNKSGAVRRKSSTSQLTPSVAELETPTDVDAPLVEKKSPGRDVTINLPSTKGLSHSQSSQGSGGFWQKLFNLGAGMFSAGGPNSPDDSPDGGGKLGGANDTSHELWLSDDFSHNHFLVGVLLHLTNWALTESKDIRHRAVKLLRNQLAKHAFDARYASKQQQARIAILYFPLLSMLMEHLEHIDIRLLSTPANCDSLTPTKSEGKRASTGGEVTMIPLRRGFAAAVMQAPPRKAKTVTVGGAHTIGPSAGVSFGASGAGQANGDASRLSDGAVGESSTDPSSGLSSDQHSDSNANIRMIDSVISNSSDENAVTQRRVTGHKKSGSVALTLEHSLPFLVYSGLDNRELRDLLICVVYVLKHASSDVMNSWWKLCNEQTLMKFLKLLELCLETFKYKGRKNFVKSQPSSKGFNVVFNSLPASLTMKKIEEMAADATANESASDPNSLVSLESSLSHEVGLVVLDALSAFCSQFQQDLEAPRREHPLLEKVMELFLSFLDVQHSDVVIIHAIAALRQLLKNLSGVLFRSNNSYCAAICQKLLRCADSNIDAVQTEACAMLYLLMKQNYENTGRRNFTRMHLQIIISLSQMLGDVSAFNSAQFHQALAVLSSFVNADRSVQYTAFAQEVRDVVRRQRTVLMATSQLQEHADDAEMLADLQHSLADSYSGTPELRRTWLESLAKLHLRFDNLTEAAYCHLHVAALIAEYLKRKGIFRNGCDLFAPVSDNIQKDETHLKDDGSLRDVLYNEETFIDRVELAADLLIQAQRFELLGFLYRLILPLYEEKRRFEDLSRVYKRLAEACDCVIEYNRSGRRRLGTYFRVGFYGQQIFESEHGKEYIYKEPKVTSLAEVANRLQTLYGHKYGVDNIKLIMDSHQVNADSLDAKCGFVQITHVNAHFDEKELAKHKTEYERNTNVSRFVFETPFTQQQGKARANCVEEQWKRKTFMTTSYAFPYIVKRIPICSKRTQEFDPLEVALNEMQQRTDELTQLVNAEKPDLIRLQLCLQGAVQATVNAGPIAYAEAFTATTQKIRFGGDRVTQLKETFKQFLLASSEALVLNGSLVSSDQFEYHQSLVENFRQLVDKLTAVFGEEMLPESSLATNKRSSAQVFNEISGMPLSASNA